MQSRLANAQSALTLNQEVEGDYPYANLAARRKLLRMQHLMGKVDSQWTKTADAGAKRNNHSQQKSFAALEVQKMKHLL